MYAINRLFRALVATGLIFTARARKKDGTVRDFHGVPVDWRDTPDGPMVTLWDRHAEHYRTIRLRGVLSVNAFGSHYDFA